MASESRREGVVRRAILQGVYDDNLRTVRGAGSRAPAGSRRPRHRARWAVPVLLGVLLLLAWRELGGPGTEAPDSRPPDVAIAEDASRPAAGAMMDAVIPAPPRPPGEAATIAALYGLQVQTIVLDPGHGGADPGTIGRTGLMEKDVTLDVARRLKARLEQVPGYRILLTREEDVRVSLKDRVAFANEHGADLFVSVHVNWLPDDAKAPIETFYYGPGSDDRTRQMAERENRNSGYTLAEFNELTQRLGLALKMQESRDAAASIQRSLFRNSRKLSEHASDWGAKSGDFVVLLGVEAPSVLVEVAAISNHAEEARLNTPEHREKLATFLQEGISNYLRHLSNKNGSTDHASEEEGVE